MMRGFSARRTSRGWRIETAPPDDPVSEAALDALVAEGNRRMAGRLPARDDLPETWRLELEKAVYTFGRAQLGLAETFAARCRAAPDETHRIAGPAPVLTRWSLMQALAAAGEPVKGLGLMRLRARLVFLASAVAGYATWLASLARDPGGGRLPHGARALVGVHPEATNRTGHVFRALGQAPETPLILLGRAVIGRKDAERFLKGRNLNPAAAVRPYDLASAAAALPAWLSALGGGATMAATAPVVIPVREQAAMTFRMAFGLAAARWWRRSGLRPEAVVLGHCGLADTAPLEREIQAGGAKTVHWLHGLSAGGIYNGVSDLLVTQCGHDARWMTAIGDYRRSMAFPRARPAFRPDGPDGLAVLTNFAHPAHPSWAAHGLRDELALVDLMQAVVARLRVPPGSVIWRPHPVIATLPEAVGDQLAARLAAAGFGWERAAPPPLADLAGVGRLVSTPSGAAVDLLGLGRLPVIAAPHPIDPDHALAAFSRVGSDAAGLEAALRAPADEAAFAQVWEAVAPGAVPAYDDIIEETRRGEWG